MLRCPDKTCPYWSKTLKECVRNMAHGCYRHMTDYEKILSKIPYYVIEQHLKRRREETKDAIKWAT